MSGEKAESVCSSDSELTNLEGAVGGICQENMDTGAGDSVAPLAEPSPSQEAPGPSQPAGAGKVEMSVDDNYQRLVQERKNEIMFELRRLQLGDRPVTGQGNREAVDGFFTRAFAPAEEQVVNPEENRPEAVTVEVDALIQRRPVSSMLGSVGFRRSLETALMGAIGNVRGRNSPSANRAASQTESRNSSGAGASPNHPRPAPRPRPSRRPHPAASAIAEHIASRNRTPQESNSGQPPAFIPPPPVEPIDGPILAQRWVEQQPDPEPEVVEEQRNLNVWDTLEQSQRDDLITDISELVQRQLVTSALGGEFRPVLENQMRERVEATGTDGRRVQQFIRTLPGDRIRRNDFSELGIPEAFDPSLSDEMSVISATAAVTVNAQGNAATNREIRSLKSQMQELRNMMRLSFDLQLDIQRSIRQEVAAALSQALACGPVASEDTNASRLPSNASGAPVASRPVDDDSCLICLDGRADSVLYQCGHMCVCHGCGMELRARGANCPVCRAPIRDIIRAYRSTQNQD